MVNNTAIPTEEFARTQLDEMRQRTGRTPSILALASRLGLSNTTFRRHFPALCAELRTRDRPSDPIPGVDAYDRLRAENQKLTAPQPRPRLRPRTRHRPDPTPHPGQRPTHPRATRHTNDHRPVQPTPEPTTPTRPRTGRPVK